MSKEAFEEKYAQSWADTPPHVRKLWLEAWQAATSAQEARVRELEEALRGLMQACEQSFDWQYDPQFSATFSEAQQALSATAREDV